MHPLNLFFPLYFLFLSFFQSLLYLTNSTFVAWYIDNKTKHSRFFFCYYSQMKSTIPWNSREFQSMFLVLKNIDCRVGILVNNISFSIFKSNVHSFRVDSQALKVVLIIMNTNKIKCHESILFLNNKFSKNIWPSIFFYWSYLLSL